MIHETSFERLVLVLPDCVRFSDAISKSNIGKSLYLLSVSIASVPTVNSDSVQSLVERKVGVSKQWGFLLVKPFTHSSEGALSTVPVGGVLFCTTIPDSDGRFGE